MTHRSRVLAAGLACICTLAGSGLASLHAQALSAFEASFDALDPLELARLADRVGDGAVIQKIGDATSARAVRLCAVRAARFLDAPEAALVPLAELARGRDPILAPAATLAAYRIASRLTRSRLEARETSLVTLGPARRALVALGADERARGDLRRLAVFAAAALQALEAPQRANQ